jgi:CheY-like chemotaxis protein
VSLEAERERHREAAEVANRAKSTFLANMSHEIRTPLTAILGYVDLLGDTTLPPAEHAAYVEVVRRNGEHLLHVINNVLDLSRIESGKLSIERLAFSPAEMLQEIASLMRVRAVAKGLTLELETSGPVPERIESDPTQFRQILINLVNNAIKFTETGGVRLRLGLAAGAHPDRPRLCVEVIDSGIGISSEMQAQVFEPFMQGDVSMARRFGGTGLGLAISRRLAMLLGGDLDLESVPGRGSTFRVSIDPGPLIGVTMLAQPLAVQASRAAAPAPLPRLDCRVLLAEDGPDNQRLLELFLRKAGAEVEIVENGELAYARAREADATDRPFDVILMDMQMPVLDGHAATAALRRAGYRRPIIALTANAMESDRERCRSAGCDDFLPKPVNRGELIAKVHQWAAVEGPRSRYDEAPLVSQLNEDDEVVDLVESFVNVLGQRVSAIELALAARNLQEVAVLAHQLKGAAGLYGFPSITAEAGAVEALATAAAPDPNAARTRLEALAALCRRAVARDPSAAESSR